MLITLSGREPFGDEFFEFLAEFNAAGRPCHGVNRSGDPTAT